MKITIDNKQYNIKENCTILEACKNAKIKIPTLCYHPDLKPEGRCGMCLVEANGKMITSCNNKISDGMIIKTYTPQIVEYRKTMIELIGCSFEKEEEFKKWLKLENLPDVEELKFKPRKSEPIDDSCHDIVMDFEKCILCGRCIQKCRELQTVNAISYSRRANATKVSKSLDKKLMNTDCVGCGQCTLVCPTGAMREKEYIEDIKKLLKNKSKYLIVQTAPSVRVSLGEEFGMPAGSLVTGKMVSALRKIGFKQVFDTDFGADLTIMEESAELIERLKKNKNLPQFSSCCPGWVNFVENFYPEFIKNLSSCKSPHQMLGAIIKSYWAKKNNIDSKNIITVSVMPCTAKKYESCRKELEVNNINDVDYVITARECAKLIKHFKIDFVNLKNEDFDKPLGESTGAGVIFGASGGVMESAIRTAHFALTGKELKNIDYKEARYSSGIKNATIKIGNTKLNLAIVHSLKNARKLLEDIKTKKTKYDFVEIMACPGGCIGGGGQPKTTNLEVIKKRAEAIYSHDKKLKFRQSHNNPEIKKLYSEFLGKPLSKNSHKLLHTTYSDKSKCSIKHL